MKISKFCHITTSHRAFDDRIFHKECKTLAKAGYNVSLIAQHDKDEIVDGVKIIALPQVNSRFERMLKLPVLALIKALKQKADIYHFHDPEFLPVGVFLKILISTKVIYDVHEDYELKIRSKEWLRQGVRKPIAFLFNFFENFSSLFFNYIITADSHIKMKFNAKKTEVIANYVPLRFIENVVKNQKDNLFRVIYVGGISEDRGIYVMIKVMKYLRDKNIELHILGDVKDHNIIKLFNESEKIKYHGYVLWDEVSKYLINADVGIILLQPTPSYVNCSGEGVIKLFEYMVSGLAIIISDFPGLNKFISNTNCGIATDPTDPRKIAEAIEYLHINPDIRKQLGENGRKAVYERYNWENESKKLVTIYSKL